jgi:hypothetical protein
MKKFILLVLAVVFAAAPALAGDVALSGKYWFQGYQLTDNNTDVVDAWYIDDYELIVKVTQGDVQAVVDLEVADNNRDDLFGNARARHSGAGSASTDIVDQYYVTGKLMDGLVLKAGCYYLSFGANIAIFRQGGFNVGAVYSLDAVDLGLTIAKTSEGSTTDADADTDLNVISANFKKAGPFTKLNVILAYNAAEESTTPVVAESTDTFLGAEFAIPAGPVALSGELGTFSGDNKSGDYLFLAAGLKDLVGFDLNAIVLYSTLPDAGKTFGFGEAFQPLLILLNNDLGYINPGNSDLTLLLLTGSYAVNDKVTIGAALLPVAQLTDEGDAIGTEIDVTATYKFADNLNIMAGLGYFMPDGDDPVQLLTTKATFSF